MSVGKVLTRLRLCLGACLVVAVTAGILVGTAGAAPPSDWSTIPANSNPWNPQETTVPYLAWRGEEVRLVKCATNFDVATGAPTSVTNGGFFWPDVSMQIFAYSGPQENSFDGPKTVQNSASVFFDHGTICVRGTFISNKPGLVIIKLSVAINGVQFAVHDFLVGWMAVNSADITNPGTVTEDPGTLPGNSVNVQVTGSIPLNAEFQADYGLPATLIMPDDWATVAHTALAQTDDNLGSNGLDASSYWDIHDSSGPQGNESPDGSPDVHVNQVTCPDSTPDLFVDQVDDCTGDEELYSRIFGDLTFGHSGPFDPSFPETLLSDGRLNSSDAPMPALKIVFNSAGGMGGFDNSCLNDKDNAYNRNFDPTNIVPTGEEQPPLGPDESSVGGVAPFTYDCVAPGTSEDDPHALYAPYYSQYIPATSRDPFGRASGIDGPVLPGQPNNFPGFGWYGLYENWEIAKVVTQGAGGPSDCLLTTGPGGPIFRPFNGFPTQVIEYTDEHGEARAQWQPGLGADFFNDFVEPVQGGCDLEGVTFPSQTITASARYPFQNVSNDIPVTGSITKNINNLFHKAVVCTIKANGFGYICTASAIDINGNGAIFNGESVCFSREPENIFYDVGGSIPHENGYCVELSGGGPGVPAEASVETPATIPGTVIDVLANFTGEHLWRDTCIVTGQPVSGPCGGAGGTATTGTTSGTTSGTGTSGTSGITLLPNQPGNSKKAGKATLVSAQFVATRHGRVLMVKVRSASLKTAKIQVRLINARGRVIVSAVRVVKTNKRVAVPHLRISKSVKRAAVKVLS